MKKVSLSTAKGYSDPAVVSFIDSFFSLHAQRLAEAGKILLKPNLLLAAPPERGITTHPLFVEAAVTALKKYTDAELFLGDSPGANFGKYETVLKKTGMAEICEKHGIRTVRMEASAPKIRNGRVYAPAADEADIIINTAKLKTHSLTGLTLCVKNMFGLVPGNAKVGYHREHPDDRELAYNIYDFFSMFEGKILNLLDGITAHEGDGPSRGKPVHLGLMAASSDAVALDAAVTRLLGFDEDFCLTTLGAKRAGYDTSLIQADMPAGRFRVKIPVSKKVPVLPEFLKSWVSDRVFVKPFIITEKCIKCRLCVKSCPVDAIRTDGEFFIETDKCIECFCCHEVCESDAVGMRRSFLHKVFVR
ncbi:MAG: DUF362 domain-containing protein [Deferribacterales bacterium]